MKTTRYRFEQIVQETTLQSKDWLKQEFKHILEGEKDYTAKADYIGYSILSIDEKVSVLEQQIKEMVELKHQLKAAKDIALIAGAEVFESYGIDKLEGAGISSITLTAQKQKEKQLLEILNEDEIIKRGYFTLTIDEEKLMEVLNTIEGKYELLGIAQLKSETMITAAKLKINKRRGKQECSCEPSYTLEERRVA